MALDKQVYLYSVDTSALYDDREIEIHKKMLNLYGIRKCLKDTKKQNRISALGVDNNVEWWSKEINHMLDEYKKELTSVLEERLKDRTPRTLREDAIRYNNVITQFDSSLTRMLQLQPGELTTDLISLSVYFFQVFHSVMLDGFMFNGEKYIFLTASAGQIRKKMAVFIKESRYKEIEMTLMCGLTVDEINRRGGINPNKFCAYKALSNSATDVWEGFDIDKTIVVEDFETDVPGEVDYIDETDYSITRKMTNTSIPHTDGCGMMLDSGTRMVRMPWVKGLLVTFPFDEFIKEHCGGECVVSDIYGAEHKIIAEGIRYIFTKSQFKLYKYYDSWEQYKAAFKKYGCEACYCNIEEPYIPKAKINYQMLQTLSDMSDDEIEKITRKTREEISKVGADYRTNMRLLGATEYNQTPNSFQKALMIYPELFVDTYSREVLKQTKKSLVKQAKGGRLEVNGRYQFIAPDLYAFSQWLFLGDMNPCGLLADGDVFSQLNTDGVELACLRSPHLYREWAIRRNKKSEEAKRWFGVTKCLYTSCHDLISRYLMFDVDGDKSLVVQDRTLTACAKRNMKDIRPLAYDLHKAKGGTIANESLYEGMATAYTGGNIGPISNNITKVWNSGEIGEEQLSVVKWLCLYNNAVIDYAKSLWLPVPPKDKARTIKNYTKRKVPYFFIYAKDKEERNVEENNENVMGRITKAIPSPAIKFRVANKKFNYTMLMYNGADCSIPPNEICERYEYWLKNQHKFKDPNESIDDQTLYMYKTIRDDILSLGEHDYVVNTLINYVYSIKKSSNKKMLWACFGEEMVENLKRNTASLGKICPICGKRFHAAQDNYVCCSDKCAAELKRCYDIEYQRKS